MYSKKVKKFVQACEKKLPSQPKKMSRTEKKFIIKMVQDELEEFKQAKNLVEEVDAMVDIIYYIIDRAIKNGIDLDPIFQIVHQTNMKKIVRGKVIRRKDGKILKPTGWKNPKPLIIEELAKQASLKK